MQIRDCQKYGERLLTRHEIDYILSGILGISPVELYLDSDRFITREECCKIFNALKKRLSGMPLQYILGETEFFSLPFLVRPGVFIPRPETEVLVEHALRILKMSDGVVADICTGCGNIALSLAKNTGVKVVGTDISDVTLDVARENARRLNLTSRVEFLEGDLFRPIEEKKYFNRFSLIVSNPPYISSEEWEALPEEVKYHEPSTALFGGKEGLDFYRRISCEAKRFIKDGGYLLLEVGPAVCVLSLLRRDGWQDIEIIKDYNNLDRVIICRWAGRHG